MTLAWELPAPLIEKPWSLEPVAAVASRRARCAKLLMLGFGAPGWLERRAERELCDS